MIDQMAQTPNEGVLVNKKVILVQLNQLIILATKKYGNGGTEAVGQKIMLGIDMQNLDPGNKKHSDVTLKGSFQNFLPLGFCFAKNFQDIDFNYKTV